MKSVVTPGIVLGNIAGLFLVTAYTFRYAERSSEYGLLGEAGAAGLYWVVWVAILAVGAAVLSWSYTAVQRRLMPYARGLYISVPVLIVGWMPILLVTWSWSLN